MWSDTITTPVPTVTTVLGPHQQVLQNVLQGQEYHSYAQYRCVCGFIHIHGWSVSDDTTDTTPSTTSTSVISTADIAVEIPLTPAQVLLTPIVGPSYGKDTTRVGSSGNSARDLCCHQAHKELTHLLLLSSLTKIPLFIESVVARYTTISRLRAATRADIKYLWIRDGTTPNIDNVDNLLSLAR